MVHHYQLLYQRDKLFAVHEHEHVCHARCWHGTTAMNWSIVSFAALHGTHALPLTIIRSACIIASWCTTSNFIELSLLCKYCDLTGLKISKRTAIMYEYDKYIYITLKLKSKLQNAIQICTRTILHEIMKYTQKWIIKTYINRARQAAKTDTLYCTYITYNNTKSVGSVWHRVLDARAVIANSIFLNISIKHNITLKCQNHSPGNNYFDLRIW